MAREISRQTFLRGAVGALAAGAVFGSVRATADPNTSGWDGLSAAIGGKVLRPDDGAQFATAKQVFNTNYNGATPAAIIALTSAADVQKAMAFAAAHNLKVAPRSGGHSYVGASTANGTMVLDLRQLPGEINYDAATGQVTVTPATSLYAMHEVLAAAGRGIPTGICPTVGAAGHALGGGLGAQSRHAGLMCDALTSASVVLPGGQAVTASSADNPDLMWALRGGGGGNFGVTTSLTFATFPTADVDVVNLNFPPQSFAQVLVGWQNWLRSADRSSWALADSTTDEMGTHCRIMATCPAGSGGKVAGAITSAVGMQPTGTDNHTFNYLDLVRYLAVGTSTHRRLDMSADPMFFQRSPRPPPRGSPRRLTRFRVARVACWRSCMRSTALSPLWHRVPPPFRGGGSPRWCSGTSKHPVPRRQPPAGSTPHIKRCNRIRSAVM